MAGMLQATPLPPQKIQGWRVALAALLVTALGACGAIDYDIEQKSFFAAASKNDDMAVVHVHYADGEETYDMHVRRVSGGYALQAPIYRDSTGSGAHFTASSTKEMKYFVGIEARLSF